LLLRANHQSSEVSAARASAEDASKMLVPHVLSYSYQTLDADVTTATDAATGNFKQNLQALMTQVVKPSATNDNVVTKATVTHTSVVEAQPDEVILLVLLSQESTSRTQTTPVVSSSSARVQLHRVNGQWLVSDLQPL
jgi:Mce-associated membrane protein